MKMELIHERTYPEHYDLEGAIERFYDSFPDAWGSLDNNKIERDSHVENVYEATDVMENGLKLKVEIFLADDTDDADEDEAWVCKAYKIS
ncbi:TPA: hypothetical protein SA741_005482 [Bacillus cereus]|nr:hypothetical protein [Bacillus thuringiensis]HEF7293007.1 hypothetical protein [Bacillus cereus]